MAGQLRDDEIDSGHQSGLRLRKLFGGKFVASLDNLSQAEFQAGSSRSMQICTAVISDFTFLGHAVVYAVSAERLGGNECPWFPQAWMLATAKAFGADHESLSKFEAMAGLLQDCEDNCPALM